MWTGYLLFLIIYYAPLCLYWIHLEFDQRAAGLLRETLTNSVVWLDLSYNLVGHLFLTGMYYWLIHKIATPLISRLPYQNTLVKLLTALWAWLLLNCINAEIFPNSNYLAAPAIPTQIVLLSSGAILLASIWIKFSKVQLKNIPRWAITVILIILTIKSIPENTPVVYADTTHRNIILIGVDSLSPNVFEISKSLLPNMNKFVQAAKVFQHAYTPLARTCPSWTSILTGQTPAQHGAYFNLRDINKVDKTSLVTRKLQEHGYQTIFALDERRFCNLDESYFFDQIVGPKAGVLDFLIQPLNDTPLTNLALQIPESSLFFPYSRINTASYSNYDSDGLLQAIKSGIDTKKPLFLAVHFESAHFPYLTARTPVDLKHDNQFISRQSAALHLVDQQIGKLFTLLNQQGALDNALVIFLSDHGEALGEIENIHYKDKKTMPYSYGHGTNIISDWQTRAMLAIAEYKNGNVISHPTTIQPNISFINLKEIIENYATNGNVIIPVSDKECFTLETGFRLFSVENYNTVNPQNVAAEGAKFYTVNSQGRMMMREDMLKQLIASKDLGAWCGEKLTIRDHRKHTYQTFIRHQDNSLHEVAIDQRGRDYIQRYLTQYKTIAATIR